jgi:hypothetical protein
MATVRRAEGSDPDRPDLIPEAADLAALATMVAD